MLKDGYELEMGFGRNGDGTVNLLEIAKNCGRFRLGFKPTSDDKRSISLERKEKCLVYKEPWVEKVPICHINKIFMRARWMYKDQVAMLNEETHYDQLNWV